MALCGAPSLGDQPWRTYKELNEDEVTEGEWKYVIRGTEPNLKIVRLGPQGKPTHRLSSDEVPHALKERMAFRIRLYERTRCYFPDPPLTQ